MERPSFYQRYAAVIKMGTLSILILLLLIPQVMVQDVIRERQTNQEEVERDIASRWGLSQTVTGPIITIPYQDTSYSANIHILPKELNISGELDTALLHRAIYEVMTYKTDLQIEGSFDVSIVESLGLDPKNIQWQKASLSLGISDLKGIQERIRVTWDSNEFNMNPGIDQRQNFSQGVSAPVTIMPHDMVNFTITLPIKGSDRLAFVPVGEMTRIKLTSACPNPSFDGDIIPVDRDVNSNGFSAEWKVLNINRPFPQVYLDRTYDIQETTLGVSLRVNIDHYLKSMRSAKYAILMIAMTFITFFFMEVMNKKKIHPIQYILIGLVLVVFYVLLLSLSEQNNIGFDLAYLIASSAVISLVTFYTYSALGSVRKGGVIFSILTVLYGFIYIILQMAEQSLLVGSIGLFLFLAAVMITSRKVDWYKIGMRDEDGPSKSIE